MYRRETSFLHTDDLFPRHSSGYETSDNDWNKTTKLSALEKNIDLMIHRSFTIQDIGNRVEIWRHHRTEKQSIKSGCQTKPLNINTMPMTNLGRYNTLLLLWLLLWLHWLRVNHPWSPVVWRHPKNLKRIKKSIGYTIQCARLGFIAVRYLKVIYFSGILDTNWNGLRVRQDRWYRIDKDTGAALSNRMGLSFRR